MARLHIAWVALPKGKEPNVVRAETFANANASINEKTFFYGCVSSIFFVKLLDRLWVRKNGINARWLHPKKFFQKHFGNPVCCGFRGVSVQTYASPKKSQHGARGRKKYFSEAQPYIFVIFDRWGFWGRKKRNKCAMLLCFANGVLYFVLPPEQNQDGAQGMGKKSICYGRDSSLFFRFFVFCPFRFIPFFCLKREKCDCNIVYLFNENDVIFQFRLLISWMGKDCLYVVFIAEFQMKFFFGMRERTH